MNVNIKKLEPIQGILFLPFIAIFIVITTLNGFFQFNKAKMKARFLQLYFHLLLSYLGYFFNSFHKICNFQKFIFHSFIKITTKSTVTRFFRIVRLYGSGFFYIFIPKNISQNLSRIRDQTYEYQTPNTKHTVFSL